MKKYPCKLIQDLMPLYIEKEVSEESKKVVEEHLKECEACRQLLKNYSEDEPDLNTFSEDLPKANTFRKLMKRLKMWIFAGIALILVLVIGITTLGYKLGKEPKGDLLSVNSIVNTFEKQGLKLEESNSKITADMMLGRVKPSVFTIGNTKERLMIYIFKSFNERKTATSKVVNGTANYLGGTFDAKNAYIRFIENEIPKTTAAMDNVGKIGNLISNITFGYLNGGKVIIYKGESASWEVTLTLKYYNNWMTDEKGVLENDSYEAEDSILKYRLSYTEDLGQVSIEYTSKHGGGSGTDTIRKSDNSVHLGTFSGGAVVPENNDTYNFTVIIKGKQEKLTLKAN